LATTTKGYSEEGHPAKGKAVWWELFDSWKGGKNEKGQAEGVGRLVGHLPVSPEGGKKLIGLSISKPCRGGGKGFLGGTSLGRERGNVWHKPSAESIPRLKKELLGGGE